MADDRESSPERRRASRRRRSGSPSPAPSPSQYVDRGRSRVRRPSGSYDDGALRRRGYHALLSSFGKIFHVEKRWKLIREMGSGAYGVVISAADDISGETVAIKLIPRIFDKVQLAKRALREITLLRHFAGHENITGLIDVDAISPDFNEIYIFMEPMEADLHQIIKSGQTLTNEHVQYFMYQVLRGMKYVHSASVIHRDLKPGNLLVNADCELKICDFGLARGFDACPDDEERATHLTEYVATRWYRAPEIMLAFRRYNTAIDVWSIGCILAELLLGRPLFKGKDYVDQLNKVIDVLGTPDEDVIRRISSEKAQAYVRSLPIKKTVPFRKIIPSADAQAIDLLTKMLTFDPDKRITVADALAHPWLATYHDEADEPVCAVPFDKWRALEELETLDDFRVALWDEIEEYRREVRGLPLGGASGVYSDLSGEPLRSVSGSGSGSPYRVRRSRRREPAEDEGVPCPEPESPPHEPEPEPEHADAKGSDSGVSGLDSAVEPPKSKSRSPAVARRREGTIEPPPPDGAGADHLRGGTPTDPVVSYARRSTIMGPSRQGSTYSSPYLGAPPLPAYLEAALQAEPHASAAHSGGGGGAFPFPSVGPGFVVPARSRTASIAGGETMSRKLLRTLSTVSIYESAEGLPIHQYIVERQTTGADAPASELPPEFNGSIAEEDAVRSREGSGSGTRTPASGQGEGGRKRKEGMFRIH